MCFVFWDGQLYNLTHVLSRNYTCVLVKFCLSLSLCLTLLTVIPLGQHCTMFSLRIWRFKAIHFANESLRYSCRHKMATEINKNVKVKFFLEQAAVAYRGSRCIALLLLQPRCLTGVGGQRHAPAALPPGKTRYPLYRRLGGPQGRSGRVRKISPPTGIRSLDRPARSESLYRLSYPGRLQKLAIFAKGTNVKEERIYWCSLQLSYSQDGRHVGVSSVC